MAPEKLRYGDNMVQNRLIYLLAGAWALAAIPLSGPIAEHLFDYGIANQFFVWVVLTMAGPLPIVWNWATNRAATHRGYFVFVLLSVLLMEWFFLSERYLVSNHFYVVPIAWGGIALIASFNFTKRQLAIKDTFPTNKENRELLLSKIAREAEHGFPTLTEAIENCLYSLKTAGAVGLHHSEKAIGVTTDQMAQFMWHKVSLEFIFCVSICVFQKPFGHAFYLTKQYNKLCLFFISKQSNPIIWHNGEVLDQVNYLSSDDLVTLAASFHEIQTRFELDEAALFRAFLSIVAKNGLQCPFRPDQDMPAITKLMRGSINKVRQAIENS